VFFVYKLLQVLAYDLAAIQPCMGLSYADILSQKIVMALSYIKERSLASPLAAHVPMRGVELRRWRRCRSGVRNSISIGENLVPHAGQ